MNIHDATEQAYKNGYEAGKRDFKNKLLEEISKDDVSYYEFSDYFKGYNDCLIKFKNILKGI